MSKELPYFKFFSDQWIGKSITLETYELQGVFISVCAIYWTNDCRVAIATLKRRYGDAIPTLIGYGYINDENGYAKIKFLDEQFVELSKNKKNQQVNGLKGSEVRWGKKTNIENGDPNGYPIALRKEKKRKEKIRKDKIIKEIEYNYSELKNEFKNSQTRLEQIAKTRKITLNKVLDLVEMFFEELNITEPNGLRTVNEAFKHFFNWTKYKLEIKNSKFKVEDAPIPKALSPEMVEFMKKSKGVI